jgi:hypothetical protein
MREIYSKTNILVSPLDEKNKDYLEKIKICLGNEGDAYSQNTDNPKRQEYHYFLGDSVVYIEEFSNRANIKIESASDVSLRVLKYNLIEKILNGEKSI